MKLRYTIEDQCRQRSQPIWTNSTLETPCNLWVEETRRIFICKRLNNCNTKFRGHVDIAVKKVAGNSKSLIIPKTGIYFEQATMVIGASGASSFKSQRIKLNCSTIKV